MSHRSGACGLVFALLFAGCGGGGGSGGPKGGAGGAAGAGGTGPRECSPGITQVCVGPGACSGGQHCLADGSGWSPCDCGGAGGTGGTGGTGGSAGTTGIGGTTGNAGTGGTTGGAGTSGAAGASGTAGTTGAAGTAGGSGSTGTAGTAGSTGAAGAAGSSGSTGAAGAAGGSGSTGAAGAAGRGGSTGVAGTTGAGGAAGVGGTTGGAGAGGSGGCGALIDNMEAGTGLACKDNLRDGYWFSYRDSNSTLSPTEAQPRPSTVSPPRGSSQRALRTYGTFVEYAGVGCRLVGVAMNTFNAHAYSGIQFYAKGTASALKVIVQTASTESTTYGGLCTLPTLSCAGNEAPVGSLSVTDWGLVQIPFSSLANGTAAFNRMEIWSIEFQPGVGAFDFWIDDLSFY